MATDTLEIFGTEYTGVTGIKATDDNDNTKIYIRPQGTKQISANGTGIDVAAYATADVSVLPTLETKSKTYTPTTSQQTDSITASSGYDGLQEVDVTINAVASGTAGTPTATKGTVSNHSVTVTPSVTNTTGYITGSTKTGTAVTVSASELVSGSETKTANGTYDVTNLAELIINVSGGGSSGLEYATGTWTPESDTANAWVPLDKTHSTPPAFYYISDVTGSYDSTTSSIHFVMYIQHDRFGFPTDYISSSSQRYGVGSYSYRANASSFTASTVNITRPYSNTGTTGTSYPRYWAQENQIRLTAGSTSRYARANRTYKWLAIWAPTGT